MQESEGNRFGLQGEVQLGCSHTETDPTGNSEVTMSFRVALD